MLGLRVLVIFCVTWMCLAKGKKVINSQVAFGRLLRLGFSRLSQCHLITDTEIHNSDCGNELSANYLFYCLEKVYFLMFFKYVYSHQQIQKTSGNVICFLLKSVI